MFLNLETQAEPSRFWMSSSILRGDVVGAYLSTTFPSLSTRNFVKFHLMPSPNNPPFCNFKNLQRGAVFLPFTSTLSKIGNSALNMVHAASRISSLLPGSCPRNWLQGNAKISNPWLLYFSYKTFNSLQLECVRPLQKQINEQYQI